MGFFSSNLKCNATATRCPAYYHESLTKFVMSFLMPSLNPCSQSIYIVDSIINILDYRSRTLRYE